MKSQINPTPAKPILYPWIGEDTAEQTVVLFTSKEHGVVISHSSPSSDDTVGDYSIEWDMSKFTEFKGSVTLEN